MYLLGQIETAVVSNNLVTGRRDTQRGIELATLRTVGRLPDDRSVTTWHINRYCRQCYIELLILSCNDCLLLLVALFSRTIYDTFRAIGGWSSHLLLFQVLLSQSIRSHP